MFPWTVQKRSLNWPQDLDGETRVVEFYVVNDNSQVRYLINHVPLTITSAINGIAYFQRHIFFVINVFLLLNCQAGCRHI